MTVAEPTPVNRHQLENLKELMRANFYLLKAKRITRQGFDTRIAEILDVAERDCTEQQQAMLAGYLRGQFIASEVGEH